MLPQYLVDCRAHANPIERPTTRLVKTGTTLVVGKPRAALLGFAFCFALFMLGAAPSTSVPRRAACVGARITLSSEHCVWAANTHEV